MARIGRLAGALLAETNGEFYLVGNTKQPCDWEAAGFDRPATDPSVAKFVKLTARRAIDMASPLLTASLEGEALATALVHRFLVVRNGSVSERLWRLVLNRGVSDDDVTEAPSPPTPIVDANWLAEMPAPLWDIVRDTVLRCI